MLKKEENLGKINGKLEKMTKFLGAEAKTSSFNPNSDCLVIPQTDAYPLSGMNKHIFVCSKVSFADFEVFQMKLGMAIDL